MSFACWEPHQDDGAGRAVAVLLNELPRTGSAAALSRHAHACEVSVERAVSDQCWLGYTLCVLATVHHTASNSSPHSQQQLTTQPATAHHAASNSSPH
jgi:hypothetical protein